MLLTKRKVATAVIALTVLSALLAYFVKPHPPLLEMVSPQQELPDYKAHYPGDTSLANRLSKSYGLAMVLIQSPYTENNVIALEAIRSWGREQFQKEPDFLHPVSLEYPNPRRHSFIEAFFFNLFTSPRYFLEEQMGNLISWRIADFHNSSEYTSFRTSYFETFGVDADSAALLARYQTDKGKMAVGVVLWSLMWLIAFFVGLIYLITGSAKTRFERLQRVIAFLWLLLAPCYLARAYIENSVATLVSALVSAIIGLYLRFPFIIKIEDRGALRVYATTMNSKRVTFAAWMSYSLLAIQILTWLKTESLIDPDPISLLIAAATGNFVHDPIAEEKIIGRIIAFGWVVISIWAGSEINRDAKAAFEAEEKLASLKGPAT